MIETPTQDTAIQERIQALRTQEHYVDEAVTQEPALLDVLKRAARDTTPNRWQAYTRYKRELQRYVGYGAIVESLRTHWHYQAVIDALDALLPSESVYGEDEEA